VKGCGRKTKLWKQDMGFWDDIYQKLDIALSELAYEKIWSELSEGDKKVLRAISTISQREKTANVKVETIREAVKMSSNTFTTYRKRLMESGVVNGAQYGYLALSLPRLEKFIGSVWDYN
jgi:hypothetical protein